MLSRRIEMGSLPTTSVGPMDRLVLPPCNVQAEGRRKKVHSPLIQGNKEAPLTWLCKPSTRPGLEHSLDPAGR